MTMVHYVVHLYYMLLACFIFNLMMDFLQNKLSI